MSTKSREFAAPRLTGLRFEAASVPVDVLPELAAYRELVVQTAKELYRLKFGKKNVPRGFVERFQLRLSDITGGSAVTHLQRVYDVPDSEMSTLEPDEFEQARDLIDDGLDTFQTTGHLPEAFPRNVIRLFNAFGKKLRPDEAIELRNETSGRPPVRYTQETRKRLILLTSDTYTREIDVIGSITGVVSKPVRHFQLDAGHDFGIIRVPYPDYLHSVLTTALRDQQFTRIQVVGFATFDKQDAFQEFESTPNINVVTDLNEDAVEDVDDRLRTFAALEAGWLDGEGAAPTADGLEWLRGVVLGLMASFKVPLPYLYPNLEGGVQAEWTFKPWEVSAEFNLIDRTVHLHAANVATGDTHAKDVSFVHDEEKAAQRIADFVVEHQSLEERG